MKITNKYNLPQGFVDACTTEQHNAENELSATTLLKGINEIILAKRYWDVLEVDVSDCVWALFGTAVHALLQKEGEDDVCEEKLRVKVGSYKITGRVDNYNLKTGVITDYKTASVWKVKIGNFEDWKKQGLIYAWLLKKNGFEVSKCRFVALLKDHSKMEASRDASYPQSPVFIYEINVTEKKLNYIEKFIEAKVDLITICNLVVNNDENFECTEKERWYSGEKSGPRGIFFSTKIIQLPLTATDLFKMVVKL